MAQPYVPPWISGNDAVEYVMKCSNGDEAGAFLQLQQAVRDGVVDVRERGPDADRRRALLEDRGFLPDGAAWRIWFIGLAVPPEERCGACSRRVSSDARPCSQRGRALAGCVRGRWGQATRWGTG